MQTRCRPQHCKKRHEYEAVNVRRFLVGKGEDAVLKKIGEEATEVVMACKDGDPQRIVAEVADLWFHTLIALAGHGLTPGDVLAELERREGQSGLDEFAARKMTSREADGT